MNDWQLIIPKGSTVRIPLTALDENKVPFTLSSGTFTITPGGGAPAIVCTQLNGKFTMSGTFVWKGDWGVAVTYAADDVVRYNDRYYRCLTGNSGFQPPSSVKWEVFAQFTLLLSASETAGYSWKTGEYKMSVVFSNGDVNLKYAFGYAQVEP